MLRVPPVITLVATTLLILPLVGCGSDPVRSDLPPDPRKTVLPPEEQAALDRASAAMAGFDDELAQTQTLSPEARYAAQARLGSRVGKLTDTCRGTKFENKAWYLLAHWRYNFHPDGAGVDDALRELARCRQPTLKVMGQALEVQHLVRQHRLPRARELAERLRQDAQEISPKDKVTIIADPFANLVELVTLAERAEARIAAPPLPATTVDLTTGQDRPLDQSPTWRLVLSAAAVAPDLIFQLQRFASTRTPQPLAVLLLLRDSSRSVILSQLPEPCAGLPVTVAYARTAAEARTWEQDWGTAVDPLATLIDPEGRCRAVNLRPEDVSGVMGQR